MLCRLRELRDRDPQEAVGGGLRDDAGEDRRDLRRRFAVGIRQPAVQREQRRFDGEGRDEAEEDPVARAGADLDEVERVLREPVDHDCGEHQQRARHGVDHELQGRRQAARPAPDADEHVERNHHRLEERVEEQQVLGAEDTDHCAGQEQQQSQVGAQALAPDPEAVRDRSGHSQDGESDQPDGESVDADVVRDVEVAEPVSPLGKLQTAVAEVVAHEHLDPDSDLGEGGEQRQRARGDVVQR